jgi:type I toxin-antitoxin system toxin SymE
MANADSTSCVQDAEGAPAWSFTPPTKAARQLTVGGMSAEGTRILRFNASSYRVPPPKPIVRLRGRWLDRAGFAIGAKIQVAVTPGRLVLEVLNF